MEADEPDVLLGGDIAPNAAEALLHALASCPTASFVYHVSAQGVVVDHLQIDVEGKLDIRGFLGVDDNVRNGFQEIHVNFNVIADAPEDKIRDLCDLAQRRSPVFDVVSHGVLIKTNVEILNSDSIGEADSSM